MKENKIKTTKRLHKDIIQKMTWKIWEIKVSDIGKYETDPMKIKKPLAPKTMLSGISS